MPQVVVGAVISAAASSFAAGGLTAVFSVATAKLIAVNLVLSGLTSVLTSKSGKGGSAGALESGGLTQQVREAITTRKIIYGEQRVSGKTTGLYFTNDNKYAHVVLVLAGHEINDIGEIWLNDYSITDDMLDSDGTVNTGRYDGLVRVKKHLGSTEQVADSDLVVEVTEWTNDHRLRGCPYIYVRYEYNQEAFPSGFPNLSAWVQGKKVTDVRDGTLKYSNNPALCLYDYLVNAEHGMNINSTNVLSSNVIASANDSDTMTAVAPLNQIVASISNSIISLNNDNDKLVYQTGDRVNVTSTGTLPTGLTAGVDYFVIAYKRIEEPKILLADSYENALAGVNITLSGGTGTHTIVKNAEPKYSGAIVIDTADDPKTNIQNILSGMGGTLVKAGADWIMDSAVYKSPIVSFSEDDIISSINIRTKISKADRFNRVTGTYTSPINSGQPTDYPIIKNDTYASQDGEVISAELPLPFVQRPHQCQRLAKITLEKMRQEITWEATFKLNAFTVKARDVALFSLASEGWTDKPFEIAEWSIVQLDGGRGVGIRMLMRETSPEVFEWNSGEETAVDTSPNTSFNSAFIVEAPVSLSHDSELIPTVGGDESYRLLALWNMPTNQFVLQGGSHEIEYKKSTETTYRGAGVVGGSATSAEVAIVQELDISYDIRVRAINNLGKPSNWQYLLNIDATAPVAPTQTEDLGNTANPDEDLSNTLNPDEDLGNI